MKKAVDQLTLTEWYESGEAINVMRGLLTAKFTQCSVPNKCLMNTAQLALAKANEYDKYWSGGLHKMYNDTGNPEKWKGMNHFGAIMESVRHSVVCAGDGT